MKRAPPRIRITLDDGLAAYIRAMVKGVRIYGDERETIIYLIRDALDRRTESDALLQMMMPHLPQDIQRAWLHRTSVENPQRKTGAKP